MNKNIYKIIRATLCAVYKVEKTIYRLTWHELPLYKRVHTAKGRRIQKALNELHGTAYEYRPNE